ncbi:MAG: cutC [Devosia sp.]|uniref:copper homeostasis protein CutC n=1 Tax=Devosia sp. TaxID=1871048 RepID=UPI002606B2B9|nr:copper homeostasis protein CutC [Devosia sp.]MDB5588009.1 cutC [Devosia sp.]
MTDILLEICVDSAEGLAAAIAGGADRIELCSALELGGLTPSPGLIRQAALAPIPVYAMVRPRPGDFIFGQADLDVMLAEIDIIREAGLAGVVLGASRAGGALDETVLRQLATHAAGLGTTLHRAVDLVPDFDIAVDLAADLGFERILTSGGARHAVEGMDTIAAMIARAAGRVAIMAGSGVRPGNVGVLLDRLSLTQVHASCSAPARAADVAAVRLGFADPAGKETSAEIVAELKRALRR